MATQTPNPPGQPKPTTPGKPASRQSPDSNMGKDGDADEGQEIPKTGRDPSEPLDQDVANDIPIDDGDEDQAGAIELPGEGTEGERSRPPGNP